MLEPMSTDTRPSTRSSRSVLPPLLADLGCVTGFALGGRSTHESGDTMGVLLAIAWPFALAALLAHGVLLLRRLSPVRLWPSGVAVVAVTYVLGMALRVVSGRGVEGGFPVVAALFLAATMLGWRAVVLVTRRR